MKKSLILTLIAGSLLALLLLNLSKNIKETKTEKVSSLMFSKKQFMHFDGPAKFSKVEHHIRTRKGDSQPQYPMGYTATEFSKAKSAGSQFKAADLDWIERGPMNVSGRTRGLIFDPTDSTHHTWFAGSVGGGVWRTENAGESWTNLTPDLPNLATSIIAMSVNNPYVIYAGTGEGYGGRMVNGSGIWKSIDKGNTWNVLTSTATNERFQNVLRLIVNPENENEILACTVGSLRDADDELASYILKSNDGGLTWTKKLETNNSPIQQILYTPGDWQVMYASANETGVMKSMDAGETWDLVFDATEYGVFRMELDVSPKDANTVFISCELNQDAAMYFSRDGLATVSKANFVGSAPNWLGGQGWYDNAIAAHPFDTNTVLVAGSGSILSLNVSQDFQEVKELQNFENNTDFLVDIEESDIPVTSHGLASALLGQIGLNPETTDDDLIDVEVRFGAGLSQLAHRLTFNPNTFQLAFEDYIEVPFQVWDIDNNVQLTLSLVDLNEDGEWTFAEYTGEEDQDVVLIHILPYSETADPVITGRNVAYKAQYQFNMQRDPFFIGTIDDVEGTLLFDAGISEGYAASFDIVADGYSEFGGSSKGVHVDHHVLNLMPIDEATNSFLILNGNDGGVAFSDDSGATFIQTGDTFADDDGSVTSDGYNVSQFYGVDKMNGEDRYIGGTQDNGSWVSPIDTDLNSRWKSAPSGDGFEAAWNYGNTDQIIESSQFNNFFKSRDGGETWNSVSLPFSSGPFITRIASSQIDPDLVFVCSEEGVIKSTDFGDSWEIKEMPEEWDFTFFGPPIKISIADANMVWTGSGIDEFSRIAVSSDKGETWTSTANYSPIEMGSITGIATHPNDANTAYALFSQADGPKVLKTTDLGQSWTDISGFNGNVDNSSNGYPDVATYSLLVMPFDENIIWAGTEIGLFESLDGGVSWAYADTGLPAVGIWQMKIVNDQVVLATHGRGIWTITTDQIIVNNNELIDVEINSFLISPNPMSDRSVITFESGKKQNVNISLYSIDGRMVQELFTGDVQGLESIDVNRKGLSSGSYFVRIKTSEGVISKKLIVQ